MRKTLIIGSIVTVISVFAAGCGKEQTLNTTVGAEPLRNVHIFRASLSPIEESYEATGTVNARTTTHVAANLMARINSILVNEGDTVKKGQTLIEIDGRDAKAQLEKAEAGLREAQASLTELENSTAAANAAVETAEANKQFADVTFARYRKLYERKSVSGQEYDEALSRSNAAKSELERARANVQSMVSKRGQVNARIDQAKADIANAKVYASYSRIVSPVSGVVVKKFVEPGATASPGVPLLSIEDSSQYRLEAAVEESRSKLIRIGNRVNVRIGALGSGEIMGTVAEILPTSDASSRSFTMKIDLPTNPLLRTGMYGIARFSLAQKEALTVPQTAIVRRGQLTGVYIVRADGTVQFRIITAGKASDEMVEVLSGVNEGDEIACSDAEQLSDSARVR